MIEVFVEGETLEIEGEDALDRRLCDVLTERGVRLKMECGGQGSCATCSVRLRGARILYHGAELDVPSDSPWMVRSCQICLRSDEAHMEVPASSLAPSREGNL